MSRSDYPARYPGMLPFPEGPIGRWNGAYSVPNSASINWPQAQFAPRYLTPGSPSVSPYRYEAGGSLKQFEPTMYSTGEDAVGELGAMDMGDLGAAADSGSPTLLKLLFAVAGPIAMGVSYQRNKSIPWALAAGFFGLPYLTYVAYDTYISGKERETDAMRARQFGRYENPWDTDAVRRNPKSKSLSKTPMGGSIRASSQKELAAYIPWAKKEVARWKKGTAEYSPNAELASYRAEQLRIAAAEMKLRSKKK